LVDITVVTYCTCNVRSEFSVRQCQDHNIANVSPCHVHKAFTSAPQPLMQTYVQDSLGGNAKTMIIANVSPCRMCAQETLSTLQFASRAKHIRNKAVINQDTNGDVATLQREVLRLRRYLLTPTHSLLLHSFTPHALMYMLTHFLTRSFTYSLTPSHPLPPSFTHSLTHSLLMHSFTHSSRTHLLTPHALIDTLTHLHTHSSIHSFIDSLTQIFTHSITRYLAQLHIHLHLIISLIWSCRTASSPPCLVDQPACLHE